MADKVKGITIKYSADASELTKSLAAASKAASTAQKNLRQIDRALKFNPNNVNLLKQKQTELQRAIESTSKELDGFKAELKNMEASGVEKTDSEYQKLEREIIIAENKLKRFNKELINTKAQASGLGRASAKMKQFGDRAEEAGRKMRPISMYAGIAAGAIGGATVGSAKWADELNTLSKVTGIGTDKLQVYASAAELVDVDTRTIAISVSRMKRSMASAQSGTKSTSDAFKKLGVNVADSNGRLRDQDTVFQEAIESLGSMSNETERDAIAMQIFGRSAANLNPLIEDSGRTYKKVSEEFAKNNIKIIDQKQIDEAQKLNDEIDLLKAELSQAGKQAAVGLGRQLMPELKKLTNGADGLATKIANLNPKTAELALKGAAILAVASPLLTVTGKLANVAGSSFKTLSKINATIGSTATGSLALVTATAGLVAWSYKKYKSDQKSREEANKLTAAQKELIRSVNDTAKAYSETHKEAQANAKDVSLQFDSADRLIDKYNDLVNSNGKVKDSDKARADLYKAELAQALGMELDQINSLIEANGKFGKSISDVMEQQKKQAYLDAYKDDYSKAIKTQIEAEGQYKDLKVQQTQKTKDVSVAERNYTDALKAKEKYLQSGGRNVGNYNAKVERTKAALNDAKVGLSETNSAMKKTEKTWDEAGATIVNYEDATKKSINGTAESVRKTLARTPAEAKKSGSQTGKGYAKGIEGKQSDTQTAAAGLKSSAKTGVSGSYGAGQSKGTDFGTGYANGISGCKSLVDNAAAKIVAAAKAKVAAEQNSHSPSKVARKLGGYFGEGYSLGISDMTGKAKSASERLVKGAVNGTAKLASPTRGASGAGEIINAINGLSGNNAKIVLQLDGRTLAEVNAPYMRSALSQLDTRNRRKAGAF